MKSGKHICSECGIMICVKDSFFCKIYGKLICKKHSIFKRRWLILSDRYCPPCAKTEGLMELLEERGLCVDNSSSIQQNLNLPTTTEAIANAQSQDKVREMEAKAVNLEKEGKLGEAKQVYWRIVSLGFKGVFSV